MKIISLLVSISVVHSIPLFLVALCLKMHDYMNPWNIDSSIPYFLKCLMLWFPKSLDWLFRSLIPFTYALCCLWIHCFLTLLPCTDSLYWILVVIPCNDSLYWFLVLILLIDSLYWFPVLIPSCIDSLYWFLLLIPCIDSVYAFLVLIPCIDSF